MSSQISVNIIVLNNGVILIISKIYCKVGKAYAQKLKLGHIAESSGYMSLRFQMCKTTVHEEITCNLHISAIGYMVTV